MTNFKVFDLKNEEGRRMTDVVYFELNNWFVGRDYPNAEPFISWIRDFCFSDNKWCKENKLVVSTGPIDMSVDWCITAPKEWVEQNCSDLLSDKEYTYKIVTMKIVNGKKQEKVAEHRESFKKFLCFPDPEEDGEIYGRFGWKFLEYTPENFGVHHVVENDYGEIQIFNEDGEEE